MKKLLALALSIAILLGACAFAEEADAQGKCYRISELYLVYGDQQIALPELSFEADCGPDGAASLRMLSDGEAVAELGFTSVNGVYVLHMDSPSLGHRDFGFDPVTWLERSLNSGIDGLVGFLQGIDTYGAAERIMGAIEGLGEAARAPEVAPEPAPDAWDSSEPTVEIDPSKFSVEGDILGALQSCVRGPETVHMGGIEYGLGGTLLETPDGEYTETSFDIDTDKLCEILDMFHYDGEPLNLGDAIRETDAQLALSATTDIGDAVRTGSFSGALTIDDLRYSCGASFHQTTGEAGETTTISYGVAANDQPAGIQLTVTSGAHEGEAFSSGSVDMANLVMLSDMDGAQALHSVMEALSVLGMDVVTQVVAPLAAA